MRKQIAWLLALCLSMTACAAEGPETAPAESTVPVITAAETQATVQETEAVPQQTQITMENWETYFELKEARTVVKLEDEEPDLFTSGYGLFLRDEYVQKLPDPETGVDVTLRYRYVNSLRLAEGNYPESYTLGEVRVVPWLDYEPQEEERVVFYVDKDGDPRSDFTGTVSANLSVYGCMFDGNQVFLQVADELEILDISGTLMLLP